MWHPSSTSVEVPGHAFVLLNYPDAVDRTVETAVLLSHPWGRRRTMPLFITERNDEVDGVISWTVGSPPTAAE